MAFEPEHVDELNSSVGGVIELQWQLSFQAGQLRKLVARHPTTPISACDPHIKSHVVTQLEEQPLDLCMRGGCLADLKIVVGRILTLGNGHRAHTSVQCPRPSC